MPKRAPKSAITTFRAHPLPARTLGPQLFLQDKSVLQAEVEPVRNQRQRLGKPRGGFWTSSYDTDYGSGWVRWCVAYRYNEPFDLHWIVLSVPKSARVAEIDSPADLADLIERYPLMRRRRRGLDFERLSGEYDGLHLTTEGYLRTRSRRPGPALIGWDCESTLWFGWVFSKWREVEPHFKDADRFNDLWLTMRTEFIWRGNAVTVPGLIFQSVGSYRVTGDHIVRHSNLNLERSKPNDLARGVLPHSQTTAKQELILRKLGNKLSSEAATVLSSWPMKTTHGGVLTIRQRSHTRRLKSGNWLKLKIPLFRFRFSNESGNLTVACDMATR